MIVPLILVIEDDPTVQGVLQHAFEMAGYEVRIAADGISGIDCCDDLGPAAVILDLCLPGRPGKEIAHEIKKKLPFVPVIILSAITDVADKVLLFELGADDYVTKPFSPRELLARVQVALRKVATTREMDAFAFGDVVVQFGGMNVTRNGKRVPLTPREFELLQFLVVNRDRVVTRDELLNEVWGYDSYPTTRTIDNHILRLRHKLEKDPAEPLHFHTVHSVGYKFVA